MRESSRIPVQLQEALPSEWTDMRVAGVEVAGIDDSCRLYGPPGCGKSTQSSIRTAVRAFEEDLHPREMTVVTYRKSLAGTVKRNMRDWGVFPDADEQDFKYWTTIHAAASRATDFHNRFPPRDEREDHEGMVSDNEKYHFCDELGIRKKPGKPWYETRWTVFYDLYTYAKNNLLGLGGYENVNDKLLTPFQNDVLANEKIKRFNEKWGTESVEDVARKWEEYKREHNCCDFYQQLTAALDGPLPSTRHVVIDEYHDATPLMAAVTERWVEAADTVIVAGDPDQVVNSYAGASPRFFEELDGRVSRDMPVIKLSESFRVPDEHYQAAAAVLSEERKPPRLSTSGPGMLNEWTACRFESCEDGWRLPTLDTPGSPVHLWVEFGPDIMFLCRTQRRCKAVCEALDRAGIIYHSQPDVGRDWGELVQLLHALELLSNVSPSGDGDTVNATLTDTGTGDLENYAVNAEELRLLEEHTSERLHDGFEAFVNRFDGDTVGLDELDEYVKQKWWELFTAGFNAIPNLTGLSDEQVSALQTAASRYGGDLRAFEQVNTRVLTMHASKGTEASNVVVFDGITRSISQSLERSKELAENEARTWYVSLTRAKDRLHVVRNAFNGESYLPGDLCKSAYHAAKQQRGGVKQ